MSKELVRQMRPELEALIRAEQAEAALAASEAKVAELVAQVERYEEHHQAAMFMSEKHRKLWVASCKEIKRLREVLMTIEQWDTDPGCAALARAVLTSPTPESDRCPHGLSRHECGQCSTDLEMK